MPYLNVVEVESALCGLATAYPALCELIPLPNITAEGRTSHALRIGTGPSSRDGALFIGGQHAREWGSCEICVYFAADLLEAYDGGTGLIYGGKPFTAAQVQTVVECLNVFVFPSVNPDGRHHSQTVPGGSLWRRNKNPADSGGDPFCVGVDVNRNYDFLWDYPNLFDPAAPVRTSTDPCELESGGDPGTGTYRGSAAFSEAESQNVRWLLDSYPTIRWFIDIHSYSELILYPWSDDQNQTTDPSMHFANPAYNTARGVEDDTAYLEYIPATDLATFQAIANKVHDAVQAVRSKDYTVEQGYDLYPLSGGSDDYAYSRHLVDASKGRIHAFAIEWGTQFQPGWSEMELIVSDISAGLLELCLVAPCRGGVIEVDLHPPSLVFDNVPEGETTVRAAVFTVNGCGPVTFQIVSGPTVTGGPPGTVFDTPLGGTVTLDAVSASETREVRLWISYRGTNEGDSATGTFTARCNESGEEWVIDITADTVRRPRAAVVLALDQSESMTFPSGFASPYETRIKVLQFSAPPLTELIDENDGIGVAAFDHEPHDVMPVDFVGPPAIGAGRTAANSAIAGHTPNPVGRTSIGDGLYQAHLYLDAVSDYDLKAIIVLTDGHENEPRSIAEAAEDLTDERVYAIGLGTAERIRPAALSSLSDGTGGYLLMTGAMDENDLFRLSKYYMQILAGIAHVDIALDPEGHLRSGQIHRLPFVLNEADIGADIILLSPAPWVFRFSLETPAGEIIDPALAIATPTTSYVAGTSVHFYRFTLPVPIGAGAGPGTWHAILKLDDSYLDRHLKSLEQDTKTHRSIVAHGLRYNLSVHTHSNLRLRARLSQESYRPGASLNVRAVLTEYGLPLEGRARVRAELERPDGTTTTLAMAETEPGVFETAVLAPQPGIYRFNIKGRGKTLRDRAFTREQALTGAVWQGEDDPWPGRGKDPRDCRERLCDLLSCLKENLSPEFDDKLKTLGLRPEGLWECLAQFCRPPAGEALQDPKRRLGELSPSVRAQAIALVEELIKKNAGKR